MTQIIRRLTNYTGSGTSSSVVTQLLARALAEQKQGRDILLTRRAKRACWLQIAFKLELVRAHGTLDVLLKFSCNLEQVSKEHPSEHLI